MSDVKRIPGPIRVPLQVPAPACVAAGIGSEAEHLPSLIPLAGQNVIINLAPPARLTAGLL